MTMPDEMPMAPTAVAVEPVIAVVRPAEAGADNGEVDHVAAVARRDVEVVLGRKPTTDPMPPVKVPVQVRRLRFGLRLALAVEKRVEPILKRVTRRARRVDLFVLQATSETRASGVRPQFVVF